MMNYLCIPATLKQQTFPCKNRNKLTFSDQKHIPISCLFLLKEKKKQNQTTEKQTVHQFSAESKPGGSAPSREDVIKNSPSVMCQHW